MKYPLCIIVFLSLIKSQLLSSRGTLGFIPPPFAYNSGIGIYQIIFVIESFFFLSLMLFPKKNLERIQTQVLIFQGLLIGVEHSLSSLLFGFQDFLCWLVAIICAFVGCLLSINEKFRNTFISIISAYSLAYLTTIILRLGNVISCAVPFIIFYFIFLFTVKSCTKFQIAFCKSFISLLSVFVLTDSWGFFSILSYVHGVTSKTALKIVGFAVFFLLYIILGGYIFARTYYAEYVQNKISGAIGDKAAGSGEEAEKQPSA